MRTWNTSPSWNAQWMSPRLPPPVLGCWRLRPRAASRRRRVQGIVLVGAAGAAFEFLHASDLSNFNLDDEWTIPALFSSLLLLAAAAELFRIHRIWQDSFLSVSSACGLLVFAAVDEAEEP